MKKRLAIVMATLMSVVCLAGCGFDASKYVQGILDNSYKGEPSLMMETCKVSQEEANAVYEDAIDEMVRAAVGVGYSSMSEDYKTKYSDSYKRMFSMVDYQVGESKTESDGSFTVDVTCRKMNFFVPYGARVEELVTEYTAEIQKQYEETGVYPSDQEINEKAYQLDVDTINEVLNSVEYASDTEVVTVHVVKSATGNTYEIKNSDIEALQYALLDIEEFMGN
ncbi:MAG: hypothetical protein K6G69_06580 [Lachnospiraceae bacterium]|nr:hypothetical protein [Lachnospiraceae bacterium]